MPDPPDQEHAQQRAGQAAEAGAGGHQREQALGLTGREHVHQHAPGHGDRDQAERRQPDVEGARDPDVVWIEQERGAEGDEVEREEAIDPAQDPSPLHPPRDPAEQRHRRQRRQEGAGEQPLQVFDAADDAHRLAHRAQHEVAGEQQEEHGEAGDDGAGLVALDSEQPRQPGLQGLAHAAGRRPSPRPSSRRPTGSVLMLCDVLTAGPAATE